MKIINSLVLLISVVCSISNDVQSQTLLENTTPRPHNNCYWVVPGRFLAGEYPAEKDLLAAHTKLTSYLDAGITFFVDLTEEHESSSTGPLLRYENLVKQIGQARGQKIEYHRMSIRDMSVPQSQKEMNAIITTIETAMQKGYNVYVHCWGGIGRTGTVVGCYLTHEGLTGKAALRRIGEWWKTVEKSVIHPYSPHTKEQRAFVKKYKK